MKKRVLSAVFSIWLTLVTVLPANVTLAANLGNGIQYQSPDVQCVIKPARPGTPVIPCVKPDDVSWNS
jgi:hypothetical protein